MLAASVTNRHRLRGGWMAKEPICLLRMRNFPQDKDKHRFGVRADRKRHSKHKGSGKKAGVMALILDQIVLKLNLVIRDKFILVKGTIH